MVTVVLQLHNGLSYNITLIRYLNLMDTEPRYLVFYTSVYNNR